LHFLTSLFHNGLGYSGINTAKSALSTVIINKHGNKFGDDPLVQRYMKGIFHLKPAFPKYTKTWDVNKVFIYMESLNLYEITLKELTLKLVTMLTILSGQRVQTLKYINIDYIDYDG
jgi:hypothetical protein